MLFFLVQTVIISLSGVMAPGPITAATVGAGARNPHAGAFIAVGHGIVEFPLMALIYYGLGKYLGLDMVRAPLFTLGGLFLLFMGFDMLRSAATAGFRGGGDTRTPLAAGILLSMGNVYFLIWWATVGASLITKAVGFGLAGAMAFALVHWSCDFVWFYFLSAVSYKSGTIIGSRFQKSMFALCGMFLLWFGGMFLLDAGRIWFF